MATRLYFHNAAAPYTPATFRGAWDATGSAVTRKLDYATARYAIYEGLGDQQLTETSTDPEWDVLWYRGVSGPLKAATIGTGTVNLMVGACEWDASADMSFHLHIYVTQGDSDTPRGTLLSDYRDPAGANEFGFWNVNSCGMDLNAAQSLSSVAVSDGDRIVVEIGFVARNSSATTYTGRMFFGRIGPNDLSHGGAYNSGNAYIEFSETFEFSADAHVSQAPIEAIVEEAVGNVRVSQAPAEVLLIDDANPMRISQVVSELLTISVFESRVSQFLAELLMITVVESRISQIAAEILNAQQSEVRLSQVVVEVLGKVSTYCGTPSLSPAALCGKADVLAWLEWTVPVKEI